MAESGLRPNRALKVAVVSPTPFGGSGYLGGGERYPVEFARAMSRVVPCSLITFDERRASSEDEFGLAVETFKRLPIGSNRLVDPWSFRVIRHLASFDVIHCFNATKVSIALAAAARFSGKRAYLTQLGGGGRTGIRKLRLHRLFRGFLPISRYSLQQFPWMSDGDHQIIYGGGDASPFASPMSPQTESTATGFVLFTGRISPHKGIDRLIQALPENLELVVAGQIVDSIYHSYLTTQVGEKKVRFVIAQNDSELQRLYRNCLCVVLPSTRRDYRGHLHPHPELLGLTLLEGMWHSRPAIASDVASLPEIVENGRTGFTFPDGDVKGLRLILERLPREPELAKSIGASGRESVEKKFNWQTTAESALDFYRRT
ncbi:MAG TPA: glycosyltransferase family 4 protein [Actinomycetota bacterium]|nr:glycosyltransferase family 4 protein [Actinomycetota bacterium]